MTRPTTSSAAAAARRILFNSPYGLQRPSTIEPGQWWIFRSVVEPHRVAEVIVSACGTLDLAVFDGSGQARCNELLQDGGWRYLGTDLPVDEPDADAAVVRLLMAEHRRSVRVAELARHGVYLYADDKTSEPLLPDLVDIALDLLGVPPNGPHFARGSTAHRLSRVATEDEARAAIADVRALLPRMRQHVAAGKPAGILP